MNGSRFVHSLDVLGPVVVGPVAMNQSSVVWANPEGAGGSIAFRFCTPSASLSPSIGPTLTRKGPILEAHMWGSNGRFFYVTHYVNSSQFDWVMFNSSLQQITPSASPLYQPHIIPGMLSQSVHIFCNLPSLAHPPPPDWSDPWTTSPVMSDGGRVVSISSGGIPVYSPRTNVDPLGSVSGNLSFAFLQEQSPLPIVTISLSSNAATNSAIGNLGDCSPLSPSPGLPTGVAAAPFHRDGSLGAAVAFVSQAGALLQYLKIGSTLLSQRIPLPSPSPTPFCLFQPPASRAARL